VPDVIAFVTSGFRLRALQEEQIREQRTAQKRERAAQVRSRVAERVREEAERILLDLEMPNGKLLRDCTGRDCKRFGGWYQRFAEKVGPRKPVGDVLSEQDVRKLYDAAA
jgi:response regulator RpfG family c-di-GMP phosphodiesterase